MAQKSIRAATAVAEPVWRAQNPPLFSNLASPQTRKLENGVQKFKLNTPPKRRLLRLLGALARCYIPVSRLEGFRPLSCAPFGPSQSRGRRYKLTDADAIFFFVSARFFVSITALQRGSSTRLALLTDFPLPSFPPRSRPDHSPLVGPAKHRDNTCWKGRVDEKGEDLFFLHCPFLICWRDGFFPGTHAPWLVGHCRQGGDLSGLGGPRTPRRRLSFERAIRGYRRLPISNEKNCVTFLVPSAVTLPVPVTPCSKPPALMSSSFTSSTPPASPDLRTPAGRRKSKAMSYPTVAGSFFC